MRGPHNDFTSYNICPSETSTNGTTSAQYACELIYLFYLPLALKLIEDFGNGDLEPGMVEVAIEFAEGD